MEEGAGDVWGGKGGYGRYVGGGVGDWGGGDG